VQKYGNENEIDSDDADLCGYFSQDIVIKGFYDILMEFLKSGKMAHL